MEDQKHYLRTADGVAEFVRLAHETLRVGDLPPRPTGFVWATCDAQGDPYPDGEISCQAILESQNAPEFSLDVVGTAVRAMALRMKAVGVCLVMTMYELEGDIPLDGKPVLPPPPFGPNIVVGFIVHHVDGAIGKKFWSARVAVDEHGQMTEIGTLREQDVTGTGVLSCLLPQLEMN